MFEHKFKILAVGDLGIGKTTLLHAIMEDRFVAQVSILGGNSNTAMIPEGWQGWQLLFIANIFTDICFKYLS